jgi:hypothetical protein
MQLYNELKNKNKKWRQKVENYFNKKDIVTKKYRK